MNREFRIGDQERDTAVTALGEHYVAGRLTKEEYDERTAVAWQAKTHADLAPLFRDLPPLPAPQPKAQPVPPTPQARRPRAGGFPVFPIVLLVFIVAVVSHMPVWPLLLVFAFALWAKGAYWRRRASSRRSRATTRTPPGSWPGSWQQRRPY